jgi:lysozyme family protein
MAQKKPIPTFEDLRAEYITLWESAVPRVDKAKDVDATAKKILANRGRYEYIASKSGVPWYLVGAIHAMESSCNFDTHLHCGDPLTARTRNVPKGHPRTGKPPFTWEFSALDALRLKNLQLVTDWSIPRICFELERYNGWGYRQYHPGTLSPYLWSGTSHYTKGKYVSDGKWSPSAVSGQSGAIAILMRLAKLDKSITFTHFDTTPGEEKPSKVAVVKDKVKEAAKRAGEAAGNSARSFDGLVKIGTFFGLVWSYFNDGMAWAFNGVLSLTNELPDVTGQVEQQLMQAEKISGWVGIPWAQINLAVLVIVSGLVVYNVFFKKG